MRNIFCAAAMIVALASLGFAQGATVTIQNEEESTFYYVVDPADLAQVTPESPSVATKVADFFAAQATDPQFTPLAPGAQASLTGLSDGAHLLVGFFAVANQDTSPVRVVSVQAESSMGERFYALYGSPALVEATRGVGRLAQFARSPSTQEAAAPAATQVVPAAAQESPEAQPAAPQAPAATQAALAPIVSFSPSYNPVFFTREAQGDFSVQPIASSRYWTLPSIHIAALSARIDEGVLTVSLTSVDGFSSDVSYFIYAFATRSAGTPAIFTLELRPRALPDRGACILWQSADGTATPIIFGSTKVEGNTATVVASLKDMPPTLLQSLLDTSSFDLTSCRFDRATGVYEEFYFATVALSDIPVTR
jgi:hypothetical protein